MSEQASILVVEDEPAIADTIRYALETEGFAVTHFGLAADGLEACRSGRFDLAILDVGLPDKSGFDLCRELRTFSELPVLFLTARSDEIDRVVGLELGADDYVVKPFSPRELSARVRAILRRVTRVQPSESGESQQVGRTPFRVDHDRRKIFFFEKPLELTRYEFDLLALLVSRPGWVFTREQLMEQVWDDPSSSLDRTVDSHIKSVRAELKRVSPDTDAIITHRGVGYGMRGDW